MRKALIVSNILIFVLLFAIYTGCKKSETKNTKLSAKEITLINKAKEYFNDNVKMHQGEVTTNDADPDTSFNPYKDANKMADFDNASVMQVDSTNIVVVPIIYSNSIQAKIQNIDTGISINISNLSKLILYTDSLQNYHAELVSTTPDQDYINNVNGNFSGTVIIQNWNGDFLRGYKYKDGNIYNVSLPSSTSDGQTEVNVQAPVEVTTCDVIDWYTCVSSVLDDVGTLCTFDHTQTVGCYTTSWNGDASEEGGTSVSGSSMMYISKASGGISPAPNTWNLYVQPGATTGKLCGTYSWTTIGDAWYAQLYPAGFSLVGDGYNKGNLISFILPDACFQFGKYNVATTYQANQALNAAWNYAVDKVLADANCCDILGDMTVKQNFTKYIRAYLQQNYPGATFNPSGCAGNIAKTRPQYCSNTY